MPANGATAGAGTAGAGAMTAEDLLHRVLQRLDDDKAENVVTIDLRGKSTVCDYMVVASGRSQRQVSTMAEHLDESLRTVGIRSTAEGLPHADWVLVDAGDVVVHLFRPEVRSFYNIEKMWGVDLPEATESPRPTGPAHLSAV